MLWLCTSGDQYAFGILRHYYSEAVLVVCIHPINICSKFPTSPHRQQRMTVLSLLGLCAADVDTCFIVGQIPLPFYFVLTSFHPCKLHFSWRWMNELGSIVSQFLWVTAQISSLVPTFRGQFWPSRDSSSPWGCAFNASTISAKQ